MQDKLYFDAAYLILWYGDTLTVVRTDAFTGWTALGGWVEHPGLALTGFGNDLVMLGVRAASAPPEGGLSSLAIAGVAAVIGLAIIAVAVVLLMRRRKKGEEPEAPIMPPPKEPGRP
jgi:hypothetical protein